MCCRRQFLKTFILILLFFAHFCTIILHIINICNFLRSLYLVTKAMPYWFPDTFKNHIDMPFAPRFITMFIHRNKSPILQAPHHIFCLKLQLEIYFQHIHTMAAKLIKLMSAHPYKEHSGNFSGLAVIFIYLIFCMIIMIIRELNYFMLGMLVMSMVIIMNIIAISSCPLQVLCSKCHLLKTLWPRKGKLTQRPAR